MNQSAMKKIILQSLKKLRSPEDGKREKEKSKREVIDNV
jgi:hypothetical protein